MKKLIFLLLVISATALTAQNYQYFTAKQGIPKALEIAKVYFQSDSVELYKIFCIRTNLDYRGIEYSIENINPYNDSTGKSLFWYYKVCINNDTCLYIRIWNNNNQFVSDSNWKSFLHYLEDKRPVKLDSIIIDSDTLVKCYENCNYEFKENLILFHLSYFINAGIRCGFESDLVWRWGWSGTNGMIDGYDCLISAKSGKCWEDLLDVSEKNYSSSQFTIKSDPNTDIITIEINSDLFQNAELSLYDQVGVLLFADKLNNKSYELSTYNYPSGLYLLQIKYGGNVITKTVMVVH